MRVAIDGRVEEPLNRLLRRYARNAFPQQQSSDGAEELQVDQRRSIDISLATQSGSNWTIGILVEESANPGARISYEHPIHDQFG
jgi:hypothetical protein